MNIIIARDIPDFNLTTEVMKKLDITSKIESANQSFDKAMVHVGKANRTMSRLQVNILVLGAIANKKKLN